MSKQHRLRLDRTARPLGLLTTIGLALTVTSLLLWGGVSVAWLAHACYVSWWWAWIPAVATNGVMIAATRLSMQDDLDKGTRAYAAALAALGIVGDIVASGAQHYLAASARGAAIHPDPVWGFVVGGLPSFMGGALIHIVFRVVAHNRRQSALAEQEKLARIEQAQMNADRHAEMALRVSLAETTARTDEARARIVQLEAERARADADRVRDEGRAARAAARTSNRTSTSPVRGRATGEVAAGSGRSAAKTADGSGRAVSGLDVSDLLEVGRTIAASYALEGKKLTRDGLVREMRDAGRPCANARGTELLRVLQSAAPSADRPVAVRGPDRKLHAVGGAGQ